MKITKEQIEILNSFSCKRLYDSYDLHAEIQFECKKGNQLVNYLKHRGQDEDRDGEAAFYMVKNEDGLPLLFFSLKCGSLFSPFDVEAHEKQAEKAARLISILNAERDESNDLQNVIYEQLSEIAIKENRQLPDIIRRVKIQLAAQHGNSMSKAELYHNDEKTDANNPIIRVGETLPGVELMHFCANDDARDYWNSLDMHHSMGEVIFWWFIVPTVAGVQRLAGCKYFYLFAADSTEDRSLVNYYNVALKFEKPAGMIGTNKPVYDFCCEFMAQEINKIIAAQSVYFQHFNLDPNEIIA